MNFNIFIQSIINNQLIQNYHHEIFLYIYKFFFQYFTNIYHFYNVINKSFVFNDKKLGNSLEFHNKNIKYLQTLLFNLRLKLLLSRNIKIIITRCAFAIIVFSIDIKTLKSLG